MAKFDVESAYQNIPVHPYDHFILGMKRCGQFYIDLFLPFGLRSAPFNFNFIADIAFPICYIIWMTLLPQVPNSLPSVLITLTHRNVLVFLRTNCLH